MKCDINNSISQLAIFSHFNQAKQLTLIRLSYHTHQLNYSFLKIHNVKQEISLPLCSTTQFHPIPMNFKATSHRVYNRISKIFPCVFIFYFYHHYITSEFYLFSKRTVRCTCTYELWFVIKFWNLIHSLLVIITSDWIYENWMLSTFMLNFFECVIHYPEISTSNNNSRSLHTINFLRKLREFN